MPGHAMGAVPAHWPGTAPAVGQPLRRPRLRQRPPTPAEQPPGGRRHPAPAARHLNLGASGGCHHVCWRRGGSSAAAAGTWPWHPRAGGAGLHRARSLPQAPRGGRGSALSPPQPARPGPARSQTAPPARLRCGTQCRRRLLRHPSPCPERRGQGGSGVGGPPARGERGELRPRDGTAAGREAGPRPRVTAGTSGSTRGPRTPCFP